MEKSELPGGQAGYALTTSARTAAKPDGSREQPTTTETRPVGESRAAARPEDEADTAQTADAARAPAQ